jgi:hypothetical protein
LIERKGTNDFEIVLSGDANRSAQAFEDKFERIKRALTGDETVIDDE